MIPVGDVIPSRTRPVVTWIIAIGTILIAIGIRAFAGEQSAQIADAVGMMPAAFSLLRSLVATFVHLDWFSLIINVALLLIVGRTLEDRLGHDRFALLYLLGALAGAVAAALGPVTPFTAILGAGAAVGAVAGAYVVLFPRSRVLMWMPIPNDAVEIPAIVLIVAWWLCQLIAAANAFAPPGTGGVAAVWHVMGGLLMGAGVAHLLVRRERLRCEWWS